MRKGKKLRVIGSCALAFTMTLCMALFMAGCDKNGADKDPKYDLSKIDVWSAYNTEKIFQTTSYDDSSRLSDGIKLSAFKNEKESAQIVITPQISVMSYDVEISDLKCGESVLSKDAVTIYNQKYTNVTSGRITTGFSKGMYPDALLPFEKAVEYKENYIDANNNQSIWFDYSIPKDQPAGTYTGTYELKFGSQVKELPVSVTVYDYALSDDIKTRSLFGLHMYWNEGGIAAAEKDSSWDMFNAYYDFLLDYRVCGRNLPVATGNVEGFIEQLRKYGKDGRVTNITLPYTEKYDPDCSTGIDYDLFVKYLEAIYKASIEDNYNYFEKISTYFTMFDEATTAAQKKMANVILKKCYNLQGELAEKWRKDSSTAEAKDEVIDSMLNMVQLFVSYYQDDFTTGGTYCPIIDRYDSEEARELYQQLEFPIDNGSTQNTEKWWYNAGATKNPYASYNMDTELFSPRIYSWMQYAYNVTGNLYWSTSFYVLKKGTYINEYDTMQDYYNSPERFPPYNGDGFLLYPGARYGIKGPVGSIRLTAIRDGLEEYDLLYDLENYLKAVESEGVQVDFDAVMQATYSTLFSGTKVYSSNEKFARAREALAQMLITAKDTGAVVVNAKSEVAGKTFTVYVPNGVEFNGGTLIEETANGKLYSVTVNYDKDVNKLDCTFTKDGKNYGITVYLEGKQTALNLETEVFDNITVSNGLVKEMVSEVNGEETSAIKLTIPKLPEGTENNTFNLKLDSISNPQDLILTFTIYSKNDTTLSVSGGKLNKKDEMNYISIENVELKAGYNTVRIPLNGVSLSDNETLARLRFQLKNKVDDEIYIAVVMSGGAN